MYNYPDDAVDSIKLYIAEAGEADRIWEEGIEIISDIMNDFLYRLAYQEMTEIAYENPLKSIDEMFTDYDGPDISDILIKIEDKIDEIGLRIAIHDAEDSVLDDTEDFRIEQQEEEEYLNDDE